jgi:hypothetical protein
MVDLGLDVAWDMLIGTALIFSGLAIRKRIGLGLGWATPSVVLGIALIARLTLLGKRGFQTST